MRRFIISDIHGFGNVYYSMMSYLDNISKEEEIELYINGDLIDRGYESVEVLLDIIKRMDENKFKIVYLGGNHELLMHNFYKDEENNRRNVFNDWYNNGGYITYDGLNERIKEKDELGRIVDFIGNLAIYHEFDETLDGKKISLVHAAAPFNVYKSDLKIKDDDYLVNYCVWTRQDRPFSFDKVDVENNENFTIVGHTPNHNPLGYEYDRDKNYLNIDGGCAFYVSGHFDYDHFPLVEICPGYLKILTFNSNNEIICANYFDGKNIFAFNTNEIEAAREYLNNDVKIKKLSINEDGICGYWN